MMNILRICFDILPAYIVCIVCAPDPVQQWAASQVPVDRMLETAVMAAIDFLTSPAGSRVS